MPRTRKTVVILLSGKAGSGKTTVADMLENKINDEPSLSILRYAFASPIKYIAKAFIGWDGEKDEKGRVLLQDLGKVGRDYDEHIWVKHFLNQMDKQSGILPFNFAIVDDWRFPNELAYLKNNPLLELVTIRMFERGSLNGKTASDVSENSLPEVDVEYIPNFSDADHWYDYQIRNDETLDILDKKLDLILADIKNKYVIE